MAVTYFVPPQMRQATERIWAQALSDLKQPTPETQETVIEWKLLEGGRGRGSHLATPGGQSRSEVLGRGRLACPPSP